MHKKLAPIIAILTGVMWGSGGIFIKTLDAYGIDNWTMIASKNLVAIPLIFVIMMFTDKNSVKIKGKDIWMFAGAGLLGMLGMSYCYNLALTQISMSLGAVLLSLQPIFVLVLGRILFKEKLAKKKILCMGLALVGCILTSGMLESNSGMLWTYVGILMGTFSAFLYATYSIFAKFATEKNYNALAMTFYGLLFSLIVSAPLADWELFGTFITDAPVKHSILMLFQSVITSALPYILYNYALKYLDAGVTSILSAGAEPAAATLFGLFFFSEIPTVLSVCGIVVAIAALTMLCAPERTKGHKNKGLSL